jgi:hypothetical protein
MLKEDFVFISTRVYVNFILILMQSSQNVDYCWYVIFQCFYYFS